MAGGSPNLVAVGLRSALFHAASAAVTAGFVLLWPLMAAPRHVVWAVLRRYIRVQLWLLSAICGQRYRVLGRENLPPGPAILAARHESMWETLVLPLEFDLPAVLLKEEILRYPLAGAVARKLGFIGLDRSGSADRARAAFDAARAEAAAGRSILIFPSGTRDPARRDRLQKGVAVLYRALGLPCVPIALDSGTFWPWRSWLRRPGTITVRVLAPIEPGLRTAEFLERLDAALTRPA